MLLHPLLILLLPHIVPSRYQKYALQYHGVTALLFPDSGRLPLPALYPDSPCRGLSVLGRSVHMMDTSLLWITVSELCIV